MTAGRSRALATALAVVASGCGLGPGDPSPGEATLTVTRDFGSEPVLEASERDPASSETVIRFLDREAEITTRYGGGFVDSIEGTAGELAGGRSSDWFFFVNGVESPRGGAEVEIRGGDRIWWDYRDWTDAMRTPAVVGSWPEPFAQASTPAAGRRPVEVRCLGATAPCDRVSEMFAATGVETGNGAGDGPRVLVGPWARVRADPAAAQIDAGPASSGVFARFERSRSGERLVALDPAAEPVREDDSAAGLVAAVRRGDEPPTWVVTGVDNAGVKAAASVFGGDELTNRYAVFASPEVVLPLPARRGEG